MAFETVSPDYVSLIITTSGKDFNAVERRFPKSITIAELKVIPSVDLCCKFKFGLLLKRF